MLGLYHNIALSLPLLINLIWLVDVTFAVIKLVCKCPVEPVFGYFDCIAGTGVKWLDM